MAISKSYRAFVAHSAGYFAGGLLMGLILQSHRDGPLAGLSKDWVGVLAKLAWGFLYGLGFGVGLGYTFHMPEGEASSER